MSCPAAVQYLIDNRLPITAGAGLIISAGVKTLPPPGQPFHFYEWFYNWSHQFLNIAPTSASDPKK